MASEQRHVEALILSRIISGETHLRLTTLNAEHGSLVCMIRNSKSKRTGEQPDLFDYAALELKKATQGELWFVEDYRVLKRFDGIGKDYRALEYACEFARILERNHAHASDNAQLLQLALQVLEAWERRIRPDAVLLKALYLLAKNEGYAVDIHWLKRLSSSDSETALAVLRLPLDKIPIPPEQVSTLTDKLRQWLLAETDILMQ